MSPGPTSPTGSAAPGGTGAPAVTLDDVRDAARRLSGAAHRTPVLRSRTLDARTGTQTFLKCENFQRAGAFKFRGAYHALSHLTPEELAHGVVAYSSGNHAQAVALAARELGTRAVIVMPADTPRSKRDATAGYGAEIVTYDRYTEDRAAISGRIARERGLTLIPPYDHPHVIAGQGTTALELLEETGPLDALLVPVGGGGLMAGAATAATALTPGIRMIGVEPAAVETPGELTFAINRRLVDSVVLVTDDEIRAAMVFAFERLKIVVEPSGASALAALLAGHLDHPPARTGVIISGGNIGPDRFRELLG
ncbi:pyridoxal-phosphate dependent enzyme [Streptomyces sp. NPDC057579]|uniref:pyridoxal-phosphate dependent enzyme n=1 Tax=Streptomyces sp. NPDC057579 TaxID=3346172 RepID=UPI00367F83AE